MDVTITTASETKTARRQRHSGELYRSAGLLAIVAILIVVCEVAARSIFVSAALPVALLVGAVGLYATGHLAESL